MPVLLSLCFVNTFIIIIIIIIIIISFHIRLASDIFSLSSFRTPDDGAYGAFTHTLFLSFSRSSSRRKPKARTKKKKKKKNNQRKRSKRKTKRRRKRRETLIRIRKTQTSSTIYPATKSTLRSSFPVAGPLDRPGRCLRSKCTRRRTWTTSQRTKSEHRSFYIGFDLKFVSLTFTLKARKHPSSSSSKAIKNNVLLLLLRPPAQPRGGVLFVSPVFPRGAENDQKIRSDNDNTNSCGRFRETSGVHQDGVPK